MSQPPNASRTGGTPLRVLVIEDSAKDAELIIADLVRGGYDVAWEVVQTEAMQAAHSLESLGAQINIPDLVMLTLLREMGPVVWLSRYNICAIARYETMNAVLMNPTDFINAGGVGLYKPDTFWLTQ